MPYLHPLYGTNICIILVPCITKYLTLILFKSIYEKQAELSILTEYCKTLDRDEVVKKLGISVRTLKSHISSIYEKTGYNNLAKLAIYCVGNGLIVPNLETQNE